MATTRTRAKKAAVTPVPDQEEVAPDPKGTVLDPAMAVVLSPATPEFTRLAREWLEKDPQAGIAIVERTHQRDLERAAQPPVISVTVTTPEGEVQPGHYEVQTGPLPVITYHDEPAPEPEGPAVLTEAAEAKLRETPPHGMEEAGDGV